MKRLRVPLLLLLVPILAMIGCSPKPMADFDLDREGVGQDLLLSTVNGDHVEVHPVDPISLTKIPGYNSFSLGHHYSSATHPDKRKMAVVKYWDEEKPGELYLVDIPSWSEKELGLSLSQQATMLTFDQAGKLWWIEGKQNSNFQLFRYEIEGKKLSEVMKFPARFQPMEMRFLRTGEQIAVYGYMDEGDHRSGTAQLLIINGDSGETTHSIHLDKVKEGVTFAPSVTGDPLMKSVNAGLGWDLLHDRLYIVHPEGNWITQIDLREGKVSKQGKIKQSKSLWERFLGGLLPQAEAKVMVETAHRVVVSPDGSRLFVVSVKGDIWEDENGTEKWRQTSTGVQVIATDELRQEDNHNLPVNDLALSPNGRYLILEEKHPIEGSGEGVEGNFKKSGVYLYDAQKMKQLAHLQTELFLAEPYFSSDGRYAYLTDFDRFYVLDLKTKDVTKIQDGMHLIPVNGIRK